MRRILIAVASIVIVLIVIIIAIPFLIPTSVIKNQAESRLSEILGRDFKIAGDLQLRRWPPLSLQATDVELANADWAEPATMVSIAALDFDADLLALIGGRVVLDKLVLTDPIINLATDADGQGNWQMGGDDRAADAGDSVDEDSGAGVDIPEFEIGEIAINNGTLSFRDGATGETRTFEQISLAIGGEEGSRALDINASVAHEHLFALTLAEALGERINRRRLIAGGLEFRD